MSKILIFSNNSVGLYNFRHELIEELIHRGNEVAATIPDEEKLSELESTGCRMIHCPVDRRGMNPIRDLQLIGRFLRLIRDEKPDLVITYTIKPNIYGGLACRLKKVPYAVNITGLGTAFQKEGMLKTLVVTLYKVGLKQAKVVFFENSENRRIILDHGIVKPEQCCLLNGAGVNLDHYALADYPSDSETIRFLFIGRIMQEKGIDELFAAMRTLRTQGINCTLDVLGSYEENYKELIEQYTAEGWLNYHGQQKDVRPFIANSHCFVLPSWHEGMANTNLECAASGRPIITSNIPGCREAVVEGVSGFTCEPKNAEVLSETMKRFCELPYETRKAMGIAGRAHMTEVFDKKKVVAETIRAFYRTCTDTE